MHSNRAKVVAAQESLVTIELITGSLMMNEVCYILTQGVKLKAEVIRIRGNRADCQVYEDTVGVKVGDEVELTNQMLSIELGPGLLGEVFDGLQNPLQALANRDGFFLKRGSSITPLNREKKWEFKPNQLIGDHVVAGDVLGMVYEGHFEHKIFVPFDVVGVSEISWIRGGIFRVNEPIIRLNLENGESRELTLKIDWPIRKPLSQNLLKKGYSKQQYPTEPIITKQRIIDTFFPIAKGGTACIPGPFGAGKTVLQNLIAKYSSVDIVIIVACGERAGEVVETITEYPQTLDPKTGGSLMDRTVIICNTSSMPVAARESSVYTGITIGEYYRQMGYDVLLLADSTSRWAQAMREISGRLEEIPGEEAFPAYLDSAIKSVYERGGVIKSNDESTGSLTLIGTVSPAGGNFEEPVTQATLATVKTFLGLSYERAYKRFYPAIDPLISWSRYLEQMQGWLSKEMSETWVNDVKSMINLLQEGDEIYQMMKVTGEEGITIENFITYQKATLLDMVYLQQDAFDEVDIAMSKERQKENFLLLKRIIEKEFEFSDRDEIREFFTKLTGYYKNLNYAEVGSMEYGEFMGKIEGMV
ncbi:MAG: V-type ATP synthase subunit A [Epsilonproteobacteria bacterium]|nr:V-type ATP synthase subunit A [Campylobacterota bacterium]